MRNILIIMVMLSSFACRPPAGDKLFYPPKNQGKVSGKLKEASGLAASAANPHMFWSLNDSGNDAEVFLINDHASIELTCELKGVKNRDWEDIAIGAGPKPGVNYVYIADIGDNNARHEYKFIYRFVEPLIGTEKKVVISSFDTLVIKLPDGMRDSEAIMIDPISNDLFIVSKREDSVHLYLAPWPFLNDTLKVKMIEKLPFKLITAATISPDGQEVLMKNYNKIYYWRRANSESIANTLLRRPEKLSYDPEHQGEAITWARDSSGFYTLSESSVAGHAELKFFRRK